MKASRSAHPRHHRGGRWSTSPRHADIRSRQALHLLHRERAARTVARNHHVRRLPPYQDIAS